MKKILRNQGFTLIELIVVIAIIGLLASLAMPQMDKMIDRAKSVTCMGNLRTIGVAVNSYVAENNGTFPFIEPNAQDPVYPDDQNYDALPIYERLKPYDLPQQALKCPADKTYFGSKGSSYQWVPMLDGEEQVSPTIYTRRGGARNVKLSRFRICLDYEAVHFNRCNRLYADGHAVAELKDR